MINLNYRNADLAVLGSENGLDIASEFANYSDKISQIITSLNERRNKNGQGLQWMNVGNHEQTIWYVKEFASMVVGRFENVLVLGIGGSALGGMAVTEALLKPYWNFLSEEQRKARKKKFLTLNLLLNKQKMLNLQA